MYFSTISSAFYYQLFTTSFLLSAFYYQLAQCLNQKSTYSTNLDAAYV